MATTPEGRLTDQCRRHLEKMRASGRAVWYMKVHGGPMQKAGVPDFLIVLDGRLHAIELKRPGAKATPLQALTMRKIATAGGVTGVATTLNEFRSLLEDGNAPVSNTGGSEGCQVGSSLSEYHRA
jgi:hypothetical protein